MQDMEQIVAMAREVFDANKYALHNHLEMGEMVRDSATVTLNVCEDSTNPYGAVHGGCYFSLADTCAGMTARTDGRKYVTQQANVYYLRGCMGGKLTAKGSVLKRGRTSCIIEVHIYDDNNKDVFCGTFTFFCVGETTTDSLQSQK